ncbi:MAG: hypothetical protein Fur0024_3330 [Patescibacteria group bacterium]
MKKFFVFGNYGALSIAEIYKLTGEKNFHFFSNRFCILDFFGDEKKVLQNSGGSVKSGKVFEVQKISGNFDENFLQEVVIKFLSTKKFEKQKITFGVSFVGSFDSNFKKKIKEILKSELLKKGIKSRFLDNKTDLLASATLKFNKVLQEGFEIVVIKSDENLIFGETSENQDVDRWSKKDFERPNRDTTHGLLQPKLARMMINLARSLNDNFSISEKKSRETLKILDPSCGSGTILQEAVDLGFDVVGSDIAQTSVDFSKKNLQWFCQNFEKKFDLQNIFLHDVKKDFPLKFEKFFDSIVTEPFMGSQISKSLSFENFLNRSKELIYLYAKSFDSFAKVLKPSGRVIFAFPLTLVEDKYKKLSFEGKVLEKGFKIISPQKFLPILSRFSGITERGFIFGTNDQFVKREIVIFEKV